MNKHIIQLTSVTYAIRAQKLLERQGFRVYVRKFAKNLNLQGCGYGLEVIGDLDTAVQLISQAGIKIVAVVRGDAQ